MSKTVCAGSILGVQCSQAPHISQNRRSCGYVGNVDATSAPQLTSPCLPILSSSHDTGTGRAPALPHKSSVLLLLPVDNLLYSQ